MDAETEVIALLLDDESDEWSLATLDPASTTCLVRGRDGMIGLQRAESREELERTAEHTGVFKRGVPILDPQTGEVMGYELEEVAESSVAAA
jgi:hypothetical protein